MSSAAHQTHGSVILKFKDISKFENFNDYELQIEMWVVRVRAPKTGQEHKADVKKNFLITCINALRIS